MMLPVIFCALIADTLASVVGISYFILNGIIYTTPYIIFGKTEIFLF